METEYVDGGQRMREIKRVIESLGWTQKEFSERLNIPLRTVQSWCTEAPKAKRECPEYVLDLIKEKSEREEKEKENEENI